MQFQRKERVWDDYCIVEFDKLSCMHDAVISSFYNKFEYLGGKSYNSTNIWTFPSCVTSQIISEIIRNTCFMCGGLMKDGQVFINVRKCSQCGHSHT